MKKKTDARGTSSRFLVIGPALVFLAVAGSLHAGSSPVRNADGSRVSVTSVAGVVDVTMAGNAVRVEPDTTVLLPARIVTGHDGTLGLTQAGTNITVARDTDVEIPAEAVDGNLVARLVQHRGNVFYDVAPRDLGKLRVETPFLVAVIKGTQFNVAVNEDGTTISLFEGSLEIRTPDDSDVIQLNAGEIAIRSLIDNSIRIVGMDDVRVEIPAVDPQAADPERMAPSADGGAAAAADAVIVRDASAVAVLEAVTTKPPEDAEIRVGAVGLAGARPAIAMNAALEVHAIDVAADLDLSVVDINRDGGLEVRRDSADLVLDNGVELDVTPAVEVDNAPDLRIDAGLELDSALDAGPGVDIGELDIGADLILDTGLTDITLDAGGGAVDLDLNVGGNAGVEVDLELDTAQPVPTRVPRVLPRGLPLP
jgi:FecR-like protein